MLSPSQSDFLAIAAIAAVQSEKETKLPAALTLAQAIFESGWGSHSPGNNCFGIKAHAGVPGRQLLDTVEYFAEAEYHWFTGLGDGRTAVLDPGHKNANGAEKYRCKDWFAKYNDLAGCFADHARLITEAPLYQKAWKAYLEDGLYPPFVLAIGRIYAKDASYGATILSFSTGSTVAQALAKAQAA